MDQITESIGKLSTDAKEWVPVRRSYENEFATAAADLSNNATSNTSVTSSWRNFSDVKEFVPQSNSLLQANHRSTTTFPQAQEKDSYLKLPGTEVSRMQHGHESISLPTSLSVNPWNSIEYSTPKGVQDSRERSKNSFNNHSIRHSEQVHRTLISNVFQADKAHALHMPSGEEESSSFTAMDHPSAILHPDNTFMQQPTVVPAILPPSKVSSFTNTNNIHATYIQAQPYRSIPTLGSSPYNHVLWKLFRHRARLNATEMAPDDPRYKAIPHFFVHSLCLDPTPSTRVSQTRSSFGYPTSTYKVVSINDGRTYCLKRIDNVKCVNHTIASTVTHSWTTATWGNEVNDMVNVTSEGQPQRRGEKWNEFKLHHVLQHPGIVRLFKCWHHPQNRAVFFLHEYYPGAMTLAEWVRYRQDVNTGIGSNTMFFPLPESIIWGLVTQLAAAIRAVHRGRLACRSLQMNHILVTPDVGSGVSTHCSSFDGSKEEDFPQHLNPVLLSTKRVRVRINCVGIVDALEFEARKNLHDLQKEDMRCLGRIIFSLATGAAADGDTSSSTQLSQWEKFMRSNYSPKLNNLTVSLVASGVSDPPKIDDVCRLLAENSMDELDSCHVVTDSMDETLASEFESSRLLRLMLKLAFVNERPEFGYDTRWSETGDNYVLKLFRDYVFHQADAEGRPVMDLGHVVTALNKLDAADDEKIVLVSRDGKTVMVVSFADVARCLEASYIDLCNSSAPFDVNDSDLNS